MTAIVTYSEFHARPPAKEIGMRAVKAAAVQLIAVLYSHEGAVEKAVRKLQELHEQAVQFATFPETVVPYYTRLLFDAD